MNHKLRRRGVTAGLKLVAGSVLAAGALSVAAAPIASAVPPPPAPAPVPHAPVNALHEHGPLGDKVVVRRAPEEDEAARRVVGKPAPPEVVNGPTQPGVAPNGNGQTTQPHGG